MKFRKIILKLENGETIEFNPLDIRNIEFHKDWIRINDEYIEKKDVYYPNWRDFINRLTTVFKIKEFEIT